MSGRLRAAALTVLLLLVWGFLARAGPWPRWLLPDPVAVARSLGAMAADGRLGAAALRSLFRMGQGFGIAMLLGIPLGVAMARSALAQGALRPLVLGLQALPSICWLPIALLWFGRSEAAIVFVVIMGSLLAIAIATEDGVASVDPLLLRAAGTLGIRGPRFTWACSSRPRCRASSPASSSGGASPGARSCPASSSPAPAGWAGSSPAGASRSTLPRSWA